MKDMKNIRKVVLAYSGGLDTSVILKWLQDVYECEVVTFTADIGQGEEVAPAREKARKAGVKQIFIDDLREEFVRDFVFPMFRANTVYEGEYLLGTSIAPEESMWRITVSPEKAPSRPEYVELSYAQGDIVAVNGKRMTPAKVLAELNRLGGRHGIGRLDLVENRYVGMKSRGCYETPGGTIMLRAHRAIESITLDREVAHLKDDLMPRYASLIYNGYWWSPERVALQTLIDHTQKNVNGWVRIKLYKGNVIVVSRDSRTDSLFDMNIATFDEDGGAYNQADAGGFIKLNALRMRIAANARSKRGQ